MKRFLSLIVLIVAIWFITDLTINILNNRGIKEEIKPKENQVTKKVSSNQTNNMLSDVFNIYLNEERYKVKIDYIINTLEDESLNMELKIYFDGKEILDKIVVSNLDNELEDPFKDENITKYILFTENNFKVINSDKDYLFILVGYIDGFGEYYLFNNKGSLLNTKGIIAYDYTQEFVLEDMSELDIFYDEDGSRLKVDKDEVLVLELEGTKELSFKEYKYIISNNKIDKELVNTYENIYLKEAVE